MHDGVVEAALLLQIFHRPMHGSARELVACGADPLTVQRRAHDVPALAFFADTAFDRNPDVVEEELVWYGDDQDIMLSVRPGITGAWAVNGRQSLGYPERCKTELSYVRQWTVAGDMRILMRTAGVLARSAVRSDVRSLKPM